MITSLDERSRCFLVKQGHASALCRLDLQGLDDALAVLSANTHNIQLLQQVLTELDPGAADGLQSPPPEQWLPRFHAARRHPS